MKKILSVSAILVGIALTGCNVNHDISKGGPFENQLSSIQFWNGSACIFEAKGNITVQVNRVTQDRMLSKISEWYIYEIYQDGVFLTKIIDSEALAIVYR